jgi:hypothetical protein
MLKLAVGQCETRLVRVVRGDQERRVGIVRYMRREGLA